MKMLKKKLLYFLSAIWYAFVFFYVTMAIFQNVANSNVLYATIWNTALIISFVILDKAEYYIHAKIKQRCENGNPGILKRIVLFYLSGASFKTALYLFYLVVLICSALVAAEPDFPVLHHFKDYFQSVYYGILILVAADTFLARLMDDVLDKR